MIVHIHTLKFAFVIFGPIRNEVDLVVHVSSGGFNDACKIILLVRRRRMRARVRMELLLTRISIRRATESLMNDNAFENLKVCRFALHFLAASLDQPCKIQYIWTYLRVKRMNTANLLWTMVEGSHLCLRLELISNDTVIQYMKADRQRHRRRAKLVSSAFQASGVTLTFFLRK